MGRKSRRKRERRDGTWVEPAPTGRTIHFGKDDWSVLEPELKAQAARFREKFGREPGPSDPVFFDPDVDEPVPLSPAKGEAAVVAAMEQAGLEAAYIYAYQQTGMMVTEMNADQWTENDLAEWDAAVKRHRNLHAQED